MAVTTMAATGGIMAAAITRIRLPPTVTNAMAAGNVRPVLAAVITTIRYARPAQADMAVVDSATERAVFYNL